MRVPMAALSMLSVGTSRNDYSVVGSSFSTLQEFFRWQHELRALSLPI